MTSSKDMPDRDQSNDEQRFTEYGEALHHAVNRSFEPWLTALLRARRGHAELPEEVLDAIHVASNEAVSNIQTLVQADVDMALSGPLEQMRQALAGLAPILDAHGFERPSRDPVESEMRPHDVHSLGPMSFMDLGAEVHEAGIAWGAAKAYLHRQRRL